MLACNDLDYHDICQLFFQLSLNLEHSSLVGSALRLCLSQYKLDDVIGRAIPEGNQSL